MAEILNCKGMKCPQPVLKAAIKANSLPKGSVLEIHADCPTFQTDITKWCTNTGNVLINIVDQADCKVATVQL